MTGALIIFGLTYALIASEKVDKSAAAIWGAAAVILFRLVPYDHALKSIDLNVIFLIVGMMLVTNVLWRTGLFEWIAIVIAKQAKGSGVLILTEFVIVTAVVSSLLDNVTTVILIAPITILVTQILEIPTVPFLILEAVFSNIGGTATLVGDPPNILIGSASHLTFNDFIVNLTPLVLILLVCGAAFMLLVFPKMMRATDAAKERIMKANPRLAITDRRILIRSLCVFTFILLGFFLGHPLGIEPGIVALCGAFVMVVVCKCEVSAVLEKVEWATILFFVGLFILIGSLEYNHVFERVGKAVLSVTGDNVLLTALSILWFSAIASAIVDNIPLVLAMIPLIQSIVPVLGEQTGLNTSPELLRASIEDPLYWALALGACLGGNGTLIGASANVVVAQIAKKNNYKLTFMGFTRYGFPIMVASLVVSTLYIYVRYFLLPGWTEGI